MTISMYSSSIPVFRQMLVALSEVLNKAETHIHEKKIEAAALLQARLFPDMFPLLRQVQIAADFAKSVSARLANVEIPNYPDTEQSFPELRTRIQKTLDFIDGLKAESINASDITQIVLRPGTPKEKTLTGQTYLLGYGLPQFLFHVTTAYAILRHNGVEIGKRDFMGTY